MNTESSIFAQRELVRRPAGEAGEVVVTISVYSPRQISGGWECGFQISNLDESKELLEGKASGVDSFQAALHAMEQVAIFVYASFAHKNGELTWHEEAGYGLPLLQSMSDLIGDEVIPLQTLIVA